MAGTVLCEMELDDRYSNIMITVFRYSRPSYRRPSIQLHLLIRERTDVDHRAAIALMLSTVRLRNSESISDVG